MERRKRGLVQGQNVEGIELQLAVLRKERRVGKILALGRCSTNSLPNPFREGWLCACVLYDERCVVCVCVVCVSMRIGVHLILLLSLIATHTYKQNQKARSLDV